MSPAGPASPTVSILGTFSNWCASQPASFDDLNLDQVVAALVDQREMYKLEPFLWTPLTNRAAVVFRQDVFRDLEQEPILHAVRAFSAGMTHVRRCEELADDAHYRRPAQRWILEAAMTYGDTVEALRDALEAANLKSDGLIALRRWLGQYVESEQFESAHRSARAATEALDAIVYTMRLAGTRVAVRHYEEASDYSTEVLDTFDKFRQVSSTPKPAATASQMAGFMNHVEAAIIDMVALLNPEPFAALERFCRDHRGYLHEGVAGLDREAQFYLSWIDLMGDLADQGVAFCYPELSPTAKDTYATDAFDIALAIRLKEARAHGVVCNDFCFEGPERILVVSGPNQGGKTTFARTFGQLHYLTRLGVPVPAGSARLLLCDEVFTHFEREETIDNLAGKLEDDLRRIRHILLSAGPSSVIVINEIFTSTTADDAFRLSQRVLAKIIEIEAACVIVSFIDELATLGPETVSMVSAVDPARPSERTFKVLRRAPDGLAFAAAIADKYRLTYQALRDRIGGR